MKNKSILKKALDKIVVTPKTVLDECELIQVYYEAKKSEISELDFILREGPYYGYNIQDVIDINPGYLFWYFREGVLKFSPYLFDKIYTAYRGMI